MYVNVLAMAWVPTSNLISCSVYEILRLAIDGAVWLIWFVLQEQVRGRLPDPNKPASFNQLWTIEEQVSLKGNYLEHFMKLVTCI